MAFPWVFEDNFESGSNSAWTSETDTANQLDVAHYSELSSHPWSTCAPFSGAYAGRARLSGGTADAFFSTTSVTIAASTTRFIRFELWFSPNFAGTADDTFAIAELQSSGAAVEVSFGGRVVAATGVLNLGIGELAPTVFSTLEIQRGVWYTIEIKVVIDSGGGNDGTLDLFITKFGEPAATAVAVAQVTGLDQAAITNAVLGIQDHLATTTGVILFDDFVVDDARIYPKIRRYDETMMLTKSGHVFVGPGTIDNVSLMSGAGTDCVAAVYDTDVADTNDSYTLVAELKNTANNELVDPAGMPIRVTRGCYLALSGTTPRALVKMCNVPAFTDHNVRRLGRQRKV